MEIFAKISFKYNDPVFGSQFTSYKSFDTETKQTKEVMMVNNRKIKRESEKEESIIFWTNLKDESYEKEGSFIKKEEISKGEFYKIYND
jgi:phosphotransferase system IIA component